MRRKLPCWINDGLLGVLIFCLAIIFGFILIYVLNKSNNDIVFNIAILPFLLVGLLSTPAFALFKLLWFEHSVGWIVSVPFFLSVVIWWFLVGVFIGWVIRKMRAEETKRI